MKKVLIELYDSDALENIISLQLAHYDVLIFMCFKDSDPDLKKRGVIKDVITRRTGTEVVFKDASDRDIGSALTAFEEIETEYPDCFFEVDITGGDEIFIAALGRFLSGGSKNNVSAHRSDIFKGTVEWAMGSKDTPPSLSASPSLFTFSDIVKLHGGAVIGSWPEEFGDIEDNKRSEILRVWNAVKNVDWNKFCSISYVNGVGPDEKGFISRRISKEHEADISEQVMEMLTKRGIVKKYEISDGILKYMLRPSAKIEDLYVSSGTVLELYTALAASETGLFHECYTKVLLDCNGIISKTGSDPTNELDVTLMYGFVPVFISCKNTEATKEFLYEIKTMAEHFGGKYAIPMLVTSKPAFQPVKERAKEMHIMLIDDVQSMPLKIFRSAIIRSFRN